ncbi:hypothetical protein [Ekhidna sp. To15]|uniref:hypothetical protein n=1 Tax=Ekhidna sp. To15 TaxID=3395267 RepID=UPI003F522E2A
MKRKLFTAFVILGSLGFTACQEDAAMEEMEQLLQDTELNAIDGTGDGDDGDDDVPPVSS